MKSCYFAFPLENNKISTTPSGKMQAIFKKHLHLRQCGLLQTTFSIICSVDTSTNMEDHVIFVL